MQLPPTAPIDTAPPALQPEPPARLGEERFQVGDLSLNASLGPANGPPLLLIHGVTRCWQDWSVLLPQLTQRWRVIALDLRGHGASERSNLGEYLIRDFAADAVRFLELLGGEPVVVFGHSLGAMVAAVVAAHAPGRVRALVLEDPPGTTLAERVRESPFHLQFAGIQRLLATPRSVDDLTRALADLPVRRPGDGAVVKFSELRDPAALRFSAECLLKMDPSVLEPLLAGRWLDGLDWFAELPRIACPTLLLRADPALGGMLSAVEAERVAACIPVCRRVDLPGIGHNIHSTQPQRTLELVNSFLNSL